MTDPTAVLSMIHEGADNNSATRLFRGEPVLAWTLRRLERSVCLGNMVVICWEDQLQDVEPIAAGHGADLLVKGPRAPIASVEAVAAVRRWCDGWRGDLRGACDFDLGFHAPWVKEAVENLESQAAVLIDPAAALVDADIIDRLIERAVHQPAELVYSLTPPGLGGAVVNMELLQRLADAELHPGHLLHSSNEQIGAVQFDGDLPLPASVTRAHGSFKLDSSRQIWRITNAMVSLNGQLIGSPSEALVTRLGAENYPDPLPRDIVLELTTARVTSPCFARTRSSASPRQIKSDVAMRLFKECAAFDDVRLTIAGSGDPMLAENLFDILQTATELGLNAIRVESDFLDIDAIAAAKSLAGAIDILAVHLPACSPESYASVMGVDKYETVMKNIAAFHGQQDVGDRGTPLLIPIFTPTPHNKSEEKTWFDRWPYGVSAAHSIAPAATKLIVLADGRIVSHDTNGTTLGVVGQTPLGQAWLKHPLQAA